MESSKIDRESGWLQDTLPNGPEQIQCMQGGRAGVDRVEYIGDR